MHYYSQSDKKFPHKVRISEEAKRRLDELKKESGQSMASIVSEIIIKTKHF